MAVFSARKLIEDEVMKNLMLAHRRMAKEGDSKQMVKLSCYILRLAKKRKAEVIGEGQPAERG